MTMGGSESQPVRLIAVDSEGIPVTDPQILQGNPKINIKYDIMLYI